jgi:hypothetical protein
MIADNTITGHTVVTSPGAPAARATLIADNDPVHGLAARKKPY